MEVRPVSIKDCDQLGQLHFRAFPNFFLTSLGQKFLTGFYEGILKDPEGFGLGVFEGKKLLGFAVGTFQMDGFYKRVAKHNFVNLSIRILPTVFSNPQKIVKILISLKSSGKNPEGPFLLSICVDPAEENRGLGSFLIAAFEKKLDSFDGYSLTTDAENNEKANRFYIKNGLILVGQILQKKRLLNIYKKISK